MGMPGHKLSLEGFVEWGNAQPGRNEFYRGEVVPVPRVQPIPDAADRRRHHPVPPDVFIACDRDDLRTEQIFRAPTVVIEVLSPSTQAYDRSKKFALYRRVASLEEYVLVDPDTWRIEVFRAGSAPC